VKVPFRLELPVPIVPIGYDLTLNRRSYSLRTDRHGAAIIFEEVMRDPLPLDLESKERVRIHRQSFTLATRTDSVHVVFQLLTLFPENKTCSILRSPTGKLDDNSEASDSERMTDVRNSDSVSFDHCTQLARRNTGVP